MTKKILDATCGSRTIWFNKSHPAAIYCIHNDTQRCQERVLAAAADLIENQQNHIAALLKANDSLKDAIMWRDKQAEEMKQKNEANDKGCDGGGGGKGMSKAVLISIRPKWCEKIASRKKTIEVRKNRPRLKTPFKCYIYCTKPRERLSTILKDGDENYGEIYRGKPVFIKTNDPDDFYAYGHSCAVIGEFVCDDVFERIVRVGTTCMTPKYCLCDWNMDCTPIDGLLSDACLTKGELEKYLDGGIGYGWHISDLKIYDTPKELSEFTGLRDTRFGVAPYDIKRPPQSWCYVENMGG